MKYIFIFTFFLATATSFPQEVCTLCQINLEPKWENLEKNTKSKKFGGKWILVGGITFRKKSGVKEKCCLETMVLQWNGQPVEKLQGSLYVKLPEKNFLPIEENVLSDGQWNKANQTLTFTFTNRKQTLGPINVFYVVLTIPEELESVLQNGHFSLVTNTLPEPFQQAAKENKTNLTFLPSVKEHSNA